MVAAMYGGGLKAINYKQKRSFYLQKNQYYHILLPWVSYCLNSNIGGSLKHYENQKAGTTWF